MDSKEQLKRLLDAVKVKEEASAPKEKVKKVETVYKHWDMAVGRDSTVRFLPDLDTTNPFFWADKKVITLPFSGVVGGEYPTDTDVTVTVPCMEMWEKQCPVVNHIRPWWNQGAEGKARALVYYRKLTSIFQGFVVNSGFEETAAPENPIRLFHISKSIFDIIYAAIKSGEFEDMPTDYVGGVDFKIAKTQKGEHANYGSSNWARRTRALSEAELTAIDEFGRFNLKDQRGFSEPDADGVEMIKAMFLDSLAGKPFDAESYGHAYRAYGARDNNSHGEGQLSVRPTQISIPTARVEHEDESTGASSSVPVATRANAADVLQRIKDKTMGKV